MRIIILGSTYISELVSNALYEAGHDIWNVPSKNPIFKGNMSFPEVSLDNLPEHDIKLSVQYDTMMTDLENAYNLHTGLLPEYGGCDILYHTIENRDKEQGLTFHNMTPNFDEGTIISKITYPVLPEDTAENLYKKMCAIAPSFAVASIELLEVTKSGHPSGKPTMYYRGKVRNQDIYKKTKDEIQKFIDKRHE